MRSIQWSLRLTVDFSKSVQMSLHDTLLELRTKLRFSTCKHKMTRSWLQCHTENMLKCLPSLMPLAKAHRMDTPTQPPSPPGIDHMMRPAQNPWNGDANTQGQSLPAAAVPASFGPLSGNGIGRPDAPPPFAMNQPRTWNTAAMDTPAPAHPLGNPNGSPLHAAQGPYHAPPQPLQTPNGAQYMGQPEKDG